MKIIAGNWKMNTDVESAIALAEAIVAQTKPQEDVYIVLAPPMPFIVEVGAVIEDREDIYLAAQNLHTHDSGAYTGEVSGGMLASIGVSFVLVGHSERRQYFGETDAMLKDKVDSALRNDLTPIFCCGEPLEIRNANTHEALITTQISNCLFHLDEAEIQDVVIAYEPIWAIGTGVTASTEQAQAMHLHIRNLLVTKYGAKIAAEIPILYGGSCNAQNAGTLFAQADIDGGLIGGASLKAADFVKIIAAAK